MSACRICGRDGSDGNRFCPYCGKRLAEPVIPRKPADPLVGREVEGKYLVEERIGTGAMGSIYRARDKTLGRTIVLKVLHRHLVAEEDHVRRFRREALAASRLHHPNCITVLGFGQTEEGWTYIAMEYLAGQDLCRVLAEGGPLAPRRVVEMVAQILAALDEAHGEGIVHRDLKPENIMVEQLRSQPDFVKVLDFGIAKIRDPGKGDGSSYKTATGMVFGTPEYMSPEQIRGEELDGRSDLYSLGILMYQMLTGVLPFNGDSVLEIATAHLTETPEPIVVRCPDTPAELAAFVERLMARNRDDRFPAAADARTALLSVDLDKRVRVPQPPLPDVRISGDDGPSGPRRFSGFDADPRFDTTRDVRAHESDKPTPSQGRGRGRGYAWALVLGAAGGLAAWVLFQVLR